MTPSAPGPVPPPRSGPTPPPSCGPPALHRPRRPPAGGAVPPRAPAVRRRQRGAVLHLLRLARGHGAVLLVHELHRGRVGPLGGLANYEKLFGDAAFYSAFGRTVLFTVMAVPLNYVLSLTMAVLLTSPHAKGKTVARILFFVPWLISPIVAGVIWRWIFGENFGLVNYLVTSLGGSAVPWQSNADLSLVIVAIAGAWGGTAFNMLLFVAALRNVPVSYYEAAAIDGASPWQRFRYITLPNIAPTSFIVILLGTSAP